MQLPDLTKLTDFELNRMADKNGLPDFVTLSRLKKEQVAAALTAAWHASKEAERRAAKEMRTFSSVKDLLSRLPPAPAGAKLHALGLKPLDGKELLANVERYEDLLRRQEDERRRALEAISDQLDVTVDHLLTMTPDSIQTRGAVSAAQGDLVVRDRAANWQEGEKRIEAEYGLKLPAINRSKGRKRKR